tara:strand:+ start:5902 stop:6099 length:198 start_codon:yes stop_codon:yes gene_type:complete
MATTVLDVLKKKIEESISSAQEHLTGGAAKDYADYREVVGLIRGLEANLMYIDDLSRNYLDDDND